jgi:putative DNA primase/helicase
MAITPRPLKQIPQYSKPSSDLQESNRPLGDIRSSHAPTRSEENSDLEVSQQVYEARLSICRGAFEKIAARYDTAHREDDTREIRHCRGVALQLDQRLEKLREEADTETDDPTDADGDEEGMDVTIERWNELFNNNSDDSDEVSCEELVDDGEPENLDEPDDESETQDTDIYAKPHDQKAELPEAIQDVDNENDSHVEPNHVDISDQGEVETDGTQDLERSVVEIDSNSQQDAEIEDAPREESIALPVIEPDVSQREVPENYQLTEKGVFELGNGEKPPIQITYKSLVVDALLRSPQNTQWTAQIRSINLDGQPIEILAPLTSLSGRQSSLAADLASQGVPVIHEAALRRYVLACINTPNLRRYIGAARMGYLSVPLRDNGHSLCFVLPGEILYPEGAEVAEEAVMLASYKVPAHRGYYRRGTLEDWQQMVNATRENPLFTFALIMSLSGPLLQLSNTENGGIHFYGPTSRGKTTAAQLAVTLWGNGATPSMATAEPTLVQSWHGTQNAIEAIVAAGNGTIVVLDEVGSHNNPVSIYGLSGGQTKGRAHSDGSLQEKQSWCVSILSSGEVPMAHHNEAKGRNPLKGGEAARVLDVPIEHLSTLSEAGLIEGLKRNCGRFFGTAGPAFVQSVLNRFGGDEAMMHTAITAEVDMLRDQLCEEAQAQGKTLHSHHIRAMRRLALAALGGRWAVEASILPHTVDQVMESVRAVRDAWLGAQSFVSEQVRAIGHVRDYCVRHFGQMIVPTGTGGNGRLLSNPRGIRREGKVILTDRNFQDACAGLPARIVASALDAAGILHRNDDQHKVKVSIAELGIHKTRFYVLILDRLFNGESWEAALSESNNEPEETEMDSNDEAVDSRDHEDYGELNTL